MTTKKPKREGPRVPDQNADPANETDPSPPAPEVATAAELPKQATVDEAHVAPLWDDRSRQQNPDAYLLKSEFDKTVVYRIRSDTTVKGGKRFVLTAELLPDASLHDLARIRGGGRYLLAAMRNGMSRPIVTKEEEIDGPEIAPQAPILGNASGQFGGEIAPIMETALGLAGVKGLDPVQQVMFLLMQQMTAVSREDARWLVNSFAQTIGALAANLRGSNANQADFLQYVQSQMAERNREAMELRTDVRRLMETVGHLRLEKQRLETSRPGQPLEDAIAAQVPVVAGTLAHVAGKVLENIAPMPVGK